MLPQVCICFNTKLTKFTGKKGLHTKKKKQKQKQKQKQKNKTKQNKAKQNKTKQTKQHKTKQNKTKQNKTKQKTKTDLFNTTGRKRICFYTIFNLSLPEFELRTLCSGGGGPGAVAPAGFQEAEPLGGGHGAKPPEAPVFLTF